MSADAFREEEYWHERQQGEHAPDSMQRTPAGGSNERKCSKCGWSMFTHCGGKCPDYVMVNGWPMERSVAERRRDDAA